MAGCQRHRGRHHQPARLTPNHKTHTMEPITLNLRVGRLPAASAPTGGQLSAADIDANFTNLRTAAEQLDEEKAAAAHGHAIASVTGLQAALDGKAAAAHDHAIANVTGLQAALDGKAPATRVTATASSATPNINTDTTDVYRITALAADITAVTVTGMPTAGQVLLVEITGTATRLIAWGSSFEASTVALPTTTVGTEMLLVAFLWNPATSRWRCVGVA